MTDLAAVRRLLDEARQLSEAVNREVHVIRLDEHGGWILRHPLACRIGGHLDFDCPVNRAVSSVAGWPTKTLGARWEVTAEPDGFACLGERVPDHDETDMLPGRMVVLLPALVEAVAEILEFEKCDAGPSYYREEQDECAGWNNCRGKIFDALARHLSPLAPEVPK